MSFRKFAIKILGLLALAAACVPAPPAVGQAKAEYSNMRLIGYEDLEGRPAYQLVIQRQGDRWIAYIGTQAGKTPQLNRLNGKAEPNGTLIVDVTDPRHPKYIAHIPGELIEDEGGAEFVRACSGSDLPRADKRKFNLLRNHGQIAQEMWDVTDPANPHRLNIIVNYGDRPHDIHKSWWECDTGVAYFVAGPLDWPAPPKGSHHDAGDHVLIYDLSDPAKPKFIRSFGLPGQEPGSSLPQPLVGLHGVLSTGPKGNRVYFSNGNDGDGIVEIVDREKLLNGDRTPTDENLLYPVAGRIELPPDVGSEMSFPLVHMDLPEFAKQKEGSTKDFLAVIGEGHKPFMECQGNRQMLHIFDVTHVTKPLGVSTWTVPEASGNFCGRGGSFGTQSANESFSPAYYNRVMFIAHFNAGVRAIDIRDPYHPKEVGFYIPAVTSKTRKSCHGEGAEQRCAIVIQTDYVETDDRGFIYAIDRAGTGLHILELTGEAREAAASSK
ncbi:MAG TPA: hypothetical protein VGN16_05940 [Acidobacteriaceae bacterium]|jgi:hypothetical protein